MDGFVRVCEAADVEDGRGKSLEVDGLPVAVFNDGGRFYAMLGRCPHANGPMGLGWIEDGEAVCPLHRWRFKLETGRCTTVGGYSLFPFRCEVREGQVWVKI